MDTINHAKAEKKKRKNARKDIKTDNYKVFEIRLKYKKRINKKNPTIKHLADYVFGDYMITKRCNPD